MYFISLLNRVLFLILLAENTQEHLLIPNDNIMFSVRFQDQNNNELFHQLQNYDVHLFY